MATYKVIQDIEAEDKLLGPLTLRQFIYALIVALSGFLIFRMVLGGLWWLAIFMLPHTLFFATLAAPFGHDQSSEVWLLARIRFALKPRRRIWDQSGMKHLVTITAPKKIEHALTNGLNQYEVKSRLEALANTIDSRGWSVKNVNVNLFGQPAYATEGTDRLINPSAMPQEVNSTDVTAMDDILDERNNPRAQNLDSMMVASAQAHRQQVVSQLQQSAAGTSQGSSNTQTPTTTPDYWFLSQNQTAQAAPGFATVNSHVVAPGQDTAATSRSTPDEEALIARLHAQKADKTNPAYGHMRTLQPLSTGADGNQSSVVSGKSDTQQTTGNRPQATTPGRVDPAILELANNDDLNVATIARQADKAKKKDHLGTKLSFHFIKCG